MAHFPNLTPQQRRRLYERGIDPEYACEALIRAVRAGDAPVRLLEALAAVGTGKRPYVLRAA